MTSPLEEQIKASLDNSLHAIDAKTRQQLQAMRDDAMHQPTRRAWQPRFNQWTPIAGVAMCCVIVVAFWIPKMQSPEDTPQIEQIAIVELLENPEDFDMLSDPSFYLWMDELEAQDV